MKKSVHQVTMSRRELAEAQARGSRSGALMEPLSAAQLEAKNAREREEMGRLVRGEKSGKARREMKNVEHKAQRRLYEEEIPNAMTRYPELARALEAVYAIPVYNANYADPSQAKRAMINAARMKAEGQKAGSPDNHIPVPVYNGFLAYGSLYLELKAKSYPNDAQRERFPLLASVGNAVVTLRIDDEILLAQSAIAVIVAYLLGTRSFHAPGHPSHTYVHNTVHPLSFYQDPTP